MWSRLARRDLEPLLLGTDAMKASCAFDHCLAALAVATLGATTSCANPLSSDGDGSFLQCAPLATDPHGALAGPLQIAGRLTDATGAPVVGGRITLAGAGRASRVSDFSGRYRFRVQPGSYTLAVSGDCSFSPGAAQVQVLNGDAQQDFAVAGGDCATVAVSNLSPDGSVLTIQRAGQTLGMTFATVVPQVDQAAALARLRDIATEVEAPTCALTIAGSPATERRARIESPGLRAGPLGSKATESLALTTAVAVADVVVRFESKLAVDAAPEIVNLFVAAARALTREQVPELTLSAR